MERIMAFSLASPLAKFLNGLEILLSKAQVSCQQDTSRAMHGNISVFQNSM